MEVFMLMLKRQVSKEKKFKYHWGCKKLRILNLCFADDFMLFCHGDVISASVMRRALDEFCLVSGLRPNMAKCILPVKYLGIPLDSNRISKSDCKVLLRNDDKKSCKYSVAWKEVCTQKSKGGLGLKSLQTWNEALMAKHLWNIVINKNFIWVKWVKNQWLKEDCICAVQAKSDYSWSCKQILSLRDKIINFVQVKISNGSSDGFEVQVPKVYDNLEDKVVWINKRGKEKNFSVDEIWKGIKQDSAKERNIRLFGNAGRSKEELFKIILESIRSRLMGLNLKVTPDAIEATRI
ncbi:hypothetical protein Tco_0869021 [Tanacetum coccineum]